MPKLPAFNIMDLIAILQEKYQIETEIDNIGLRPGEKIHELMINEAEIPRTYQFENMFVITSSIAKYQQIQTAAYTVEENKLSEDLMNVYCSKDAVISKEEVKELFVKLGLLEE